MKVFYFKVNQVAEHAYRYIQQWADHIKAVNDAQIYVICDKPDLTEYLKLRINFGNVPHEFIKSTRESAELQDIIENAIVPHWKFAAYAHLTPFLHSRDNGYKDFWNIDADDLGLYVEPTRMAELMRAVKEYAHTNDIDNFSLDWWRTYSLGQHWSFGFVYTRNSIDWLSIAAEHCKDRNLFFHYERVTSGINMDWYFTYLREINAARIESFYVENLRVLHHHADFYRNIAAGLRYCSNGRCYSSVARDAFGMGENGSLKIYEDVIKIDTGITAKESMDALKKCCYGGLNRFESEHGINIPVSVILVPDKNLEETPPPPA